MAGKVPGCGNTGSLRDNDEARFTADPCGDGIVCMSLELVPRLRGLRFGFERLSGEGKGSEGFESRRRRPITVPNRLRPNRRGSENCGDINVNRG